MRTIRASRPGSEMVRMADPTGATDRGGGLRMAGSNPVTIVTGASSGIGRATARALASAGHRLGLIARRKEMLNALADEIRADGGTAHVAPADVGDRPSLHAAIA